MCDESYHQLNWWMLAAAQEYPSMRSDGFNDDKDGNISTNRTDLREEKISMHARAFDGNGLVLTRIAGGALSIGSETNGTLEVARNTESHGNTCESATLD